VIDALFNSSGTFPFISFRNRLRTAVPYCRCRYRFHAVSHHGYVHDGNHFTFLCGRSPVRLVPNGCVALPGWPGLAGEFPTLPSGRSSRPASYGIFTKKTERDSIWTDQRQRQTTETENVIFYVILTDERNSYVILQRSTELRLRTNGNVTLETTHDCSNKQRPCWRWGGSYLEIEDVGRRMSV